ncbi:PAS domain-containing protein [Roseovarius pacificus]
MFVTWGTGEQMITDLTGAPGLARHAQGLRARDIEAFRRYWSRMRKAGDVPRRTDIDPRGIAPVLSEAFVAERIAPGLARLRIAGNHLNDLMGMEVRGMPLSSFLRPGDRDRLAECLIDLFDRPATLDLDLVAERRMGSAPLTGRLVLMPLRSDLGDISRALGCLVTEGPCGHAPRRFAISRSRIAGIDMGASADPERPAPAPSVTRAPLMGERPYLRLVTQD